MEYWTVSAPQPGRVAEAARRVEASGVWDGMLFTDSQHHNGDCYFALGIAASVTEHIGLGTGVTNPVTRNAAVTAGAIASVQIESGGRAVLGIGRGDSSLAHLGMKPAPVRVLETYVERLQGYLRGEAVEQNGHLAHIKWMDQVPKKVPVDVAATGPRVTALAGRHADMITFAVGADVERLQRGVDIAREAMISAGRESDALRFGAYVNVGPHTDPLVARDVIKGTVGTFAHFSSMPGAATQSLNTADRRVIEGIGRDYELRYHGDVRARHLAHVDDGFIDRFAIVGRPTECVERLQALQAGLPMLTRLVIAHGSRGADASRAREVSACLIEEVLPRLRAA